MTTGEKAQPLGHIVLVWHGQAGLAVTYWLYGILAALILSSSHALVSPFLGNIFPYFVLTLYCIFACTSIWRAADNYKGNRVWSVLAKLAIIAAYGTLAMVSPL